MSETVIVSVDVDGNVKVGVECVSGPHCKKVSEAIEKALGSVTKSEITADFRKTASVGNQA